MNGANDNATTGRDADASESQGVATESRPVVESRDVVATGRDRSAYTLTVKEVAVAFAAAGVARTVRSIQRWCEPNRYDQVRLEAILDAADGRWYVTPESVERVIAEEKERDARSQRSGAAPAATNTAPAGETGSGRSEPRAAEDAGRIRELELQLRDAMVTTRVKDELLGQAEKRELHLIGELREQARLNGVLETKLLALEAPRQRAHDATAGDVAGGSSM